MTGTVPRHALVLAAGLGTRLQPLTLARAKPAVPVAGEPLIRRIVGWLRRHGATDLVVNLHHLPATLTAVLGDGRDLGVRVRYSWEQPVVLGSAGGPRQALPLIGADRFLIVNGDTLADVDLGALAAAHAASGALVTLALGPNRDPGRYGGVRLDKTSRVTGFAPRGPAAADAFHFTGVQIAQAEAFDAVAPGAPAASIGGAYDAIVATRPGAIRGVVSDATFWDIGTLADYWRTSLSLMDATPGDAQWRGRRVRVEQGAHVRRSILWDDVVVGAGATLEDCIVADGVEVPAGATYRRSALVRGGDGLIASPVV